LNCPENEKSAAKLNRARRQTFFSIVIFDDESIFYEALWPLNLPMACSNCFTVIGPRCR